LIQILQKEDLQGVDLELPPGFMMISWKYLKTLSVVIQP
jgi:hypothetical protein